MALVTSIVEDDWVLESYGARPEVSVSASSYEVVTITWSVVSYEWKYYAVDKQTALDYITANPTLDLAIERISNFPSAVNLIKRLEQWTLASVTGSARP